MKKLGYLIILLIMLLMFLVSCGKYDIIWIDYNGTILYTDTVEKKQQPQERELPEDTDKWHYTEWKISINENGVITYTAQCIEKTSVIWQDAHGNTIHSESVIDVNNISMPSLPSDTDEWHYTGWKETQLTNHTVLYTAQRVQMKSIVWMDSDNSTVLYDLIIPYDQAIPNQPLPCDTEKWNYVKWEETYNNENKYVYTAHREPQKSYFIGNVFQIVTYDLIGSPMSVGSGFVFHKDGWFITNYHVMDNAYSANALFEIQNYSTGESFTSIEISRVFYCDANKDIFIGKLDGYHQISKHYHNINLQEKHSAGETSYSVGYPNSSPIMEVNKGITVDDLSLLSDKLYSGITYVGSTSYVAPGSSGGVLLDGNLDVIGLTTLGFYENNNFIVGAAINTFNFLPLCNQISNSKLQPLISVLHPNELTFIKFFKKIIQIPQTIQSENNSGIIYTYSFTNNMPEYVETITLDITPYGWISLNSTLYWPNGDRRDIFLYGIYSNTDKLNNFHFSVGYQYANYSFFIVESDNINYSSDINLTLRNYTSDSSNSSYGASTDQIKYAKTVFNSYYEYLYNWMHF